MFSHKLPIKGDAKDVYSFAWGGHQTGESYYHLLDAFSECPDLGCVSKAIQDLEHWKGVPSNVLMADRDDNIAYAMLASCPLRKNGYPHLGSQILDGTTSDHDWNGFASVDEMPFVMNPAKGYFITANNRVVPENSKYDHGASQMTTPRYLRIDELLRKKIASNTKMDASDMIEIMQDLTDIVARELVPKIIHTATQTLPDLPLKDQGKVSKMLGQLQGFTGEMTEDSIGASVYSYWQVFFYKSLFHRYTREVDADFWNDENVISLADQPSFLEFYAKLVKEVGSGSKRYDHLCKSTKSDGCAFSIAQAFADAYDFMVASFSDN